MPMYKTLTVLIAPLAFAGCSVFGAEAADEPAYETLQTDGPVEVRRYDELVVARTTVSGGYDATTSTAFGRLAGYIFGKNRSKQKIAMTAPVLQERDSSTSEKIAMTAPVLMEEVGESWQMTFVLPEGYTLDNAPDPVDPAVEVTTMPARTVATLRFSGRLREKSIEHHTEELERWIAESDYRAVSPPRAAGYDPPWTLPALRRNEIQIDVEPAG